MADLEDDYFSDELVDGAAEELVSKHDLQRARTFATRVKNELLSKGSPLRKYSDDRLAEAKRALVALAVVDPKDAIAITALQGKVSEYLNVRDWTRGVMEAGTRAADSLARDARGEITDDD